MRDPRDCHGAECAGCGGWFRDEDDVNEGMLCECCERDAEAEEEAVRAEEEADRAEERRHAAQEAAADLLPDDWFGIATDITGVKR